MKKKSVNCETVNCFFGYERIVYGVRWKGKKEKSYKDQK
jgi:hypothetical protein